MNRYRIKVVREFAAAHQIRNYPGNCERLHGHNWRVEATASAEKLNDIGISLDFRQLRSYLDKIIDELDHQNLNSLVPFDQVNPSTENLAKFIFERLSSQLPTSAMLEEIWIWESSRCAAGYCRQL